MVIRIVGSCPISRRIRTPNPTTPVDPCLLQNFSEQLAVAIAEAEGDDDDEGEGGAAEDTADTTIGEREMDDHDDEDAMYGPNNDPPWIS